MRARLLDQLRTFSETKLIVLAGRLAL
jgi:hypothetical protein